MRSEIERDRGRVCRDIECQCIERQRVCVYKDRQRERERERETEED